MVKNDCNSFDDSFSSYRLPDDGFPWFINISITNRCNLSCPMCQSNSAAPEVIETKRLNSFLDRLALWLKPPRRVTITGGEPLTHPGILSVTEKLSSAGYLPVVNTNAAALGVEMVDALVKAGLKGINISLDGVGEVHDRMRQGPGLFDGVMNIINYLRENTILEIYIVSVISALNAESLPELVELLDKITRIRKLSFQAITPTLSKGWSDDFYENSPLWPRNKAELQKVLLALDILEEKRDSGAKIKNLHSQFELWRRYFKDPNNFILEELCFAAQSNLHILANGDVTLCSHFDKLGTIDDDPVELWNSDKAKLIKKNMSRCQKSCNYFVNCCYLED